MHGSGLSLAQTCHESFGFRVLVGLLDSRTGLRLYRVCIYVKILGFRQGCGGAHPPNPSGPQQQTQQYLSTGLEFGHVYRTCGFRRNPKPSTLNVLMPWWHLDGSAPIGLSDAALSLEYRHQVPRCQGMRRNSPTLPAGPGFWASGLSRGLV